MIIKNIARLCKARKCIHLYEDAVNCCQWIGDGYSLYQLHGMPTLDADTVPAVLDIPENKRADYIIRHTDFPEMLDPHDDAEEQFLPQPKVGIFWKNRTLLPAPTSIGIRFYESNSLKPFNDLDEYQIWERVTPNGLVYLAIKTGMVLQGIIVPTLQELKELTEAMNQLAGELQRTLGIEETKIEEEKRAQSI